jgi:hypothetical protein
MDYEKPENWNLIYVHKIGESQVMLTATLSDRNGPPDLTDFTVTLNVKKKNQLVVDNADCVGTAEGVVTCVIDADFDAITTAGDYKAEFKCEAGPKKYYFPKTIDGERTYFKFLAQDSLDAAA